MSLMDVAKWLKVNGAINGGTNEIRWLELPSKSRSSRFQEQGFALRRTTARDRGTLSGVARGKPSRTGFF